MKRKTKNLDLPADAESWDLAHWPTGVYPHTPARGRYVVRTHRNKLVEAGAITRIGREIVIIGAKYKRWLAANAGRVTDFEIAANRASEPQQQTAA